MDQRITPTTSYKEVKIGRTIYRVTSFFSGEKEYEGNVGFVCRCRDKGAGFFSKLGRNDGELSSGWTILEA